MKTRRFKFGTRTLTSGAFCAPCEAAEMQAQTAAVTRSQFGPSAVTVPEVGTPTMDVTVARWSGVIAVEGVMTGDGRMIEAGALRWDDLPLPLRWDIEDDGAHAGAVVVGLIETVTRQDGGNIFATGFIDLVSDNGWQAATLADKGMLRGVSIDPDEFDFEIRVKSELLNAGIEVDAEEGEVAPVEPELPAADANGYVKVMEMRHDDEIMVAIDARLRAATLVDTPAFAQALIALDEPLGARLRQVEIRASGNMHDTIDEWPTLENRMQSHSSAATAPSPLTAAGHAHDGSVETVLTNDADGAQSQDSNVTTAASTSPRGEVFGTTFGATGARRDAIRISLTPGPGYGVQKIPSSLHESGEPSIDGASLKPDDSRDTSRRSSADQTLIDGSRGNTSTGSSISKTTDVPSALSQSTLSEAGEPSLTPTSITATTRVSSGAGYARLATEGSGRSVTTPNFSNGGLTTLWHKRAASPSLDSSPSRISALLAAASPVRPPAHWFGNPGLAGPTPITVTDDGRIFGHLAVFGSCHLGFESCVSPPRSSTNYAWFKTGILLADDGTEHAVGQITMGTGHAGTALNPTQTLAHYDNTGSAIADVSAGEDAYGIWVAGALRPNATDEQVRALRASPLSGDWRRVGGGLELVAALAVNVPGFVVPRGMVASGRQESLQLPAPSLDALVAAGYTPSAPDVMVVEDSVEFTAADREELKALLASARQDRAEAAAELARAIEADDLARAMRD